MVLSEERTIKWVWLRAAPSALASDVSHERARVRQRPGEFREVCPDARRQPAPYVSDLRAGSQWLVVRTTVTGVGTGAAAEQGPPLLRCTPM